MAGWRSPIRVVIAGTGTGIGKTHVACALVRHVAARGLPVVGLKPIETGLDAGSASDQTRLSDAARWGLLPSGDPRAGFHVKQTGPDRGPEVGQFHVEPSPYWFAPPLSPHLAAREAGLRVDLGRVRAWVLEAQRRRGECAAVVETAGGLFSPIGQGMTNLDLALALEPAVVVLVAPDRLGVLHEVTSTIGFADALGRPVDTAVLSEPDAPDRSTGTNAAEIDRLGIARVSAVFPRTSVDSPAAHEQARRLFDWIDREVTRRDGHLPT
jgi:dethiobiotin synthetase